MQRRARITSHMLSSSVVSPRQTLARDHEHQLVVPRMRLLTRARHNAPRVCPSARMRSEGYSWRRAGASQPSRSFERNFLFIYIYICDLI